MAKDTPIGSHHPDDKPNWHNAAPEWYRDGVGHVWLPYAQMQTAAPPLPVVATEGVHIKLADGAELIDGIGSWWTACHGYNHPHIAAGMTAQIEQMPHVMFGGLGHEAGYSLAARLARLTPGDLDHVFFADSGSVSVEVALKMALQYWLNKGIEGRTSFVTFAQGYHGDTWAAMSVTDLDQGMHQAFGDQLQDQFVADLPQNAGQVAALDRLLSEGRDSIAAMIVEPLVQGAGGMKFHDPQVLTALRELADRHEVLLIADEIFTGFGRTGTLFACEQADIVPDILCLGKGMTGGAISLAATIARDHVHEAFLSDDPAKALMHGPTYMANPLACAAANASLDLFETEPRLEQVKAIETCLRDALEACRGLKRVVDVRVKGAIGVVQVDALDDLDWLKQRFIDEGVWLRPFGDIVYVTPAFVIEQRELTKLADTIVAVLTEWDARFKVGAPGS
ncbi:MAG: adenosylmethionine--8-amino-7-oxononanoate transaminase [Sphingomonadales bacterium]